MAIRRLRPSVGLMALGALGLLLGLATLRGPGAGPSGNSGSVDAELAQLPLSFEPNAGRTDPRVDFIAHSVAGGSVYLSGPEATLALGERALRLRFSDAAADPRAVGLERLPGEVSSFIGDDPDHWRAGIPTYAAVGYRELYPGIDVEFYGDQRRLEYDFRLDPGADPSRIAIEARGADAVRLTGRGALAFEVGGRTITQRPPFAFQRISGERVEVPSGYALDGETARLRLGAYDRAKPLVIDPELVYSSYLGGDGNDNAFAIAVDSTGAPYIAGGTDSTDFPLAGQFQGNQTGRDAFVAKLNPTGTALAYSTYLGGDNQFTDDATGIAVDASGAAYVTGTTGSSNFPTQDQLQGNQPGNDGFVTKLAPSGAALDYSTYLGGDGLDGAKAIAIDSSGGAYVAGTTLSTDLPHPDAFQGALNGSVDAFVAKLNPHPAPGAVTLGYGTYLGGSGGFLESAAGIAVDSSGAAYVTGVTDSASFPTQGPIQTNQPGIDGFVTKLSPDSAADETLVYSTYLGGDGLDPDPSGRDFEEGFAIAVDSGGSAYVTGRTNSTNFPTQGEFQGNQPREDAFVTKLNPAGSGLVYSTFLGGSQNDWGYGIAVNAAGEAFVTGITGSGDFPQQDPFQPDGPGDDIFVTQLNGGGGTLGYSTLFGGDGIDWGRGIALGPSGDAYVAGFTGSTDLPVRSATEGSRPPNGKRAADDAWVGWFRKRSSSSNPCDDVEVAKYVTTNLRQISYETETDSHSDNLILFRIEVFSPQDCHWTVRETEASQQEFVISNPIPYEAYGGLTVYYYAYPTRTGQLTNTVELELQDGRKLTASAKVINYGHFTDFADWSSARVEGTAHTNDDVMRPDPAGRRADASIAKVQVALLRRVKGVDPLAKPKCQWLTKQGRFAGSKPNDEGVCDKPTWLKAKLGKTRKGKTPFSYEFKEELPPGKYVAYSRATNEAGVAEPEFTKKIGNERPFKVKR